MTTRLNLLKKFAVHSKMHARVRAGLPPEPTGWWDCTTCNKWFPNSAQCNYDWSGTCSTGDYEFMRDSQPVISSRAGWE